MVRFFILIIIIPLNYTLWLNYDMNLAVYRGVEQYHLEQSGYNRAKLHSYLYPGEYGNIVKSNFLSQDTKAEINKYLIKKDKAKQIFDWTFYSSLLIFVAILLWTLRVKINWTELQKWWMPIFMMICSWFFIIVVYQIFEDMSHNLITRQSGRILKVGVFSGYCFPTPGQIFGKAWTLKNLFLIASALLLILNWRKKIVLQKIVIISLILIDLSIGNLVVMFMHDDVDMLNQIFDFSIDAGVGPT